MKKKKEEEGEEEHEPKIEEFDEEIGSHRVVRGDTEGEGSDRFRRQ